MANILGTFAALILAFAAFVALKNKSRFANELVSKTSEQQKLKTSQDTLNDALVTLRNLPEERAGIDSQTTAKTEEKAKLKEENDGLKEQIEKASEKLAKIKADSGEAKDGAPDTGAIKKFANVAKKLSAEIEELKSTIESKESGLSVVTQQIEATEKNSKIIKDEIEALSNGDSISTLKTSIRNIYSNWGFVTLNAGNVAGVASGSTLDVVRNGETIAKLLVSSVESRTASASIIPDAIKEDVVLEVGDLVVPGKKISSIAAN